MGAFLSEQIKVANAFSTKLISAIRCLGSGHFPLKFSSSTYFLITSLNRCNREVTANLLTRPISALFDGELFAEHCINKFGLLFGPKKEN